MGNRAARRYAWCMPRAQDDDAAGGIRSRRVLIVAGGFLLAVGATLAVFLTDNPQYLRIAVVAVAWAFVLATLAAGSRGGDRAAAAAREAQLRRAYEHELDLEVAARREYELALENELRRETEQAMREELDALRSELGALADLRDQIAGVTALRDEVARVAAMREDIVALGSLHQELGQLHELRNDMGRLRAELTEELSSEMLVERIVMRTQAGRLPGEPSRLDGPTRTLDGPAWGEEPPRELTGGWPVIRLDEPQPTRQFEQVRVERTDFRPAPAASAAPAPPFDARPRETHTSASWTPPAPSTTMFAGPQPSRLGPPPSTGGASVGPAAPATAAASAPVGPATTAFPLLPPAAPAEPPPAAPAELPPSPLDWLASRELLDVPDAPVARPTAPRPSPRRRRGDEPGLPPEADVRTAERPGPVSERTRIEDRGSCRFATSEPVPPVPSSAPVHSPEEAPASGPATSSGGSSRLAEILAENGVSPSSGGRRRRRYREDGESDDVLSRVLGRD